MSANNFVLKHGRIEIEYKIGMTSVLTALVYKDGPDVRDFKVNEITTNETALGTRVSSSLATLPLEPGRPSAGFGGFLPDLDVTPGQTETFSTSGITVKSSSGNRGTQFFA